MKNGKKPLSTRPAPTHITASEVFGNNLSIPADIKKDLDSKGLTARWLNAKQLTESQGYHKNGWIVYKTPKPAPGTIEANPFGSNPDGIVRRGDCILAYKPNEAVAKHRAYLKQQADRMSGAQTRQAAELREFARENGVKTSIVEGDDEPDSE